MDQSRATQTRDGLRQSTIPLILVALVAAASFHAAYVALSSDSTLRAQYLIYFRRGALLSRCPEHLAVIAASAAVTLGLLVLAQIMAGQAYRASYDIEAIVSWFGNLGLEGPLDTSALLRVALLYPLVQHACFGLNRAIHPGELSEVLLACGIVGSVGLLVSLFGPDLPCNDTQSDTRSQ